MDVRSGDGRGCGCGSEGIGWPWQSGPFTHSWRNCPMLVRNSWRNGPVRSARGDPGSGCSWMAGARGPLAEAQARAGGEVGSQVGSPVRGPDANRAEPGTGPAALASGESNGTLAMVTAPAGSAQWLYLIDTKNHAFAIYRLDPSDPKGTVKLEAARQYQWDLKLRTL